MSVRELSSTWILWSTKLFNDLTVKIGQIILWKVMYPAYRVWCHSFSSLSMLVMAMFLGLASIFASAAGFAASSSPDFQPIRMTITFIFLDRMATDAVRAQNLSLLWFPFVWQFLHWCLQTRSPHPLPWHFFPPSVALAWCLQILLFWVDNSWAHSKENNKWGASWGHCHGHHKSWDGQKRCWNASFV